jgi:hypothetical protein
MKCSSDMAQAQGAATPLALSWEESPGHNGVGETSQTRAPGLSHVARPEGMLGLGNPPCPSVVRAFLDGLSRPIAVLVRLQILQR